MGRLPFDPGKMNAPSRPVRKESEPLRVRELAAKLNAVIASGFPSPVSVVGEVSNATHRTHWYFSLGDEEASIGCVLFASRARSLAVKPENGLKVVARGRLEFYAKTGRVSFLVDRLEEAGRGGAEAELKRRVEEARKRGWLESSAKRALPAFPRRIAVLTSKTGAAIQDVLATAARRAPWVEWTVIDCRVQGDAAVQELNGAFSWLRSCGTRFDAVLVTRGGGSTEDLWGFNDLSLAAAVRQSPVPVVAAVGHETDTTLIELVADLRCSTPTQAAEMLTPDREDLERQLGSTKRRLRTAVARRVEIERARTDGIARSSVFRDPGSITASERTALERLATDLWSSAERGLDRSRSRIERAGVRLAALKPEQRLKDLASDLDRAGARLEAALKRRLLVGRAELDRQALRLKRAKGTRVSDARHRLAEAQAVLGAIGPGAVLARGYSWTETSTGELVRSVDGVEPGQTLVTRLADGRLKSTVNGSKSGRTIRRKKLASDGPGLFENTGGSSG